MNLRLLPLLLAALAAAAHAGALEAVTIAGQQVRVRVVAVKSGSAPLKCQSNTWYRGEPGCTLRTPGKVAVRLENVSNVLVTGINVTAAARGFVFNNSRQIEFRDCKAVGLDDQGFLGSGVTNATFKKCTAGNTRAEHAWYLGAYRGNTSENILIEDSSFSDCPGRERGSSIQFNTQESGPRGIRKVLVRRTRIHDENFPVNIIGAGSADTRVVFQDCHITGGKVAINGNGRKQPAYVKSENTRWENSVIYLYPGSRLEKGAGTIKAPIRTP